METVWNPPYQGVSRCYKREQFLTGNKHAREYTNFWVFFWCLALKKISRFIDLLEISLYTRFDLLENSVLIVLEFIKFDHEWVGRLDTLGKNMFLCYSKKIIKSNKKIII